MGSIGFMIYILSLTHLCQMEFPFLINLTSPFQILGLLGGIFHFIQILKEIFVCKQWRTWSDAALSTQCMPTDTTF